MNPERAEIIVVGFELLNGTTLDTNSHWISGRLVKSGIEVYRKTTVGDILADVSKVFKEAIERKPNWIFSIGGLGPTDDDKTIEGLSIALGRPMRLDADAVRMLEQRYRERARATGNRYQRPSKSSLKMAQMPVGAKPLRNSAGSAPGVLFKKDSTTIIAFPGVPRELKAIFIEQVAPVFRRTSTGEKRKEVWMMVEGVGESRLAAYLRKASAKASPHVYIKSHPIGFIKGKSLLKIQFIAYSHVKGSESDLKLNDAVRFLKKTLSALGAAVKMKGSVR